MLRVNVPVSQHVPMTACELLKRGYHHPHCPEGPGPCMHEELFLVILLGLLFFTVFTVATGKELAVVWPRQRTLAAWPEANRETLAQAWPGVDRVPLAAVHSWLCFGGTLPNEARPRVWNTCTDRAMPLPRPKKKALPAQQHRPLGHDASINSVPWPVCCRLLCRAALGSVFASRSGHHRAASPPPIVHTRPAGPLLSNAIQAMTVRGRVQWLPPHQCSLGPI